MIPGSRRSRAAALGLLAALVALAGLGGALPLWQATRDAAAERGRLAAQLARLQALAAGREELAGQEAALAARRGKSGLLLTGTSEALAAATLQNIIKSVVDKAGGQLRSTQALPAADEPSGRRLTVRADLSTDMEGLRALLHALESGRPVLFVEDLDIRGRVVERDRVALEVRMDVSGFLGQSQDGAP